MRKGERKPKLLSKEWKAKQDGRNKNKIRCCCLRIVLHLETESDILISAHRMEKSDAQEDLHRLTLDRIEARRFQHTCPQQDGGVQCPGGPYRLTPYRMEESFSTLRMTVWSPALQQNSSPPLFPSPSASTSLAVSTCCPLLPNYCDFKEIS